MKYKVGSLAPPGYLQWHEWAEAQEEGGLTQTQPYRCGHWLFPQEVEGNRCHFGDNWRTRVDEEALGEA